MTKRFKIQIIDNETRKIEDLEGDIFSCTTGSFTADDKFKMEQSGNCSDDIFVYQGVTFNLSIVNGILHNLVKHQDSLSLNPNLLQAIITFSDYLNKKFKKIINNENNSLH